MHNDNFAENEGLKFFGKMNASISHEIRNALAVINENAGLIKDLIMMSDKGHPIDLVRVGGRVEKVLEQVKRTDMIVDNMNRFAHSIDDAFSKINAYDYVEFVIRLTDRLATMKGVEFRLENPPEPVEIATSPFLFENLIYLCLDQAMQHPDEGKTVTISINKKDDRIHFEFMGIAQDINLENNLLTVSEGILKKLGANVIIKDGSGSFILDIQREPLT